MIVKQNEIGGIDTRKLKSDAVVEVNTKNTTYRFKFIDENGSCLVQGGKYFPQEAKGIFQGSTFGGNVLKIGWIGYGMNMEIVDISNNKLITTSRVRSARLTAPGWHYEMEWPAL